jgi:simple sugar transport system substrate-binding protein
MQTPRSFCSFTLGSVRNRLAWIAAAAVVLGMWSDGARQNVAHAAAPPLTIGFVYVGPKTDYGYNQAHAQGAAGAGQAAGREDPRGRDGPGDDGRSEDDREHGQPRRRDGGVPTSFGYFDPHILKEAGKFKNVTFLHCGGLYQEGKHPANVGSYFGYIDEAQYVAGRRRGHDVEEQEAGFIAAKPIPQVLRNINSYTLGARSANPKARPP